jgi:hypothetical protein
MTLSILEIFQLKSYVSDMYMELPLVTFGKYKGRPVTDALADTSYVNWAKEKGLYDKLVVVNVMQSTNHDSPTPAHNRFQNLFLEECFRRKFVDTFFDVPSKLEKLYKTDEFVKHFGDSKFTMTTSVEFETVGTNWDVLMNVKFSSIKSNETDAYNLFRHEQDLIRDQKILEFETEKVRRDKAREYYRAIPTSNIIYMLTNTKDKSNYTEKELADTSFEKNHNAYIGDYENTVNRLFIHTRNIIYNEMFKNFESYIREKNIDSFEICISNFRIACELKPTIGDEYPCILRKFKEQRQMTINKSQTHIDHYVVAFQRLTAETVSYSQLQEIFKQSDIPIKLIEEDEDSIQSRLYKLEQERNALFEKLQSKR